MAKTTPFPGRTPMKLPATPKFDGVVPADDGPKPVSGGKGVTTGKFRG